MGCVPIGQLTLQWTKIFGTTKVIAVDIMDEKIELASKVGAELRIKSIYIDAVEVNKIIIDRGTDVCIKTAGNVVTEQQAILSKKKKGRVIFIGIKDKGLNLYDARIAHIMRRKFI